MAVVIARVAAVIPVIDEAAAIAGLVTELRVRGACCVIVVDGGSRDGTCEVARGAGALVVTEPRRGYGRACLTGAARALTGGEDAHRHDAVAFLDGDGSCDPADLPHLLAALSNADVALGRRPRRRLERGAMPVHAWLGNALVAAILSVRTGRHVGDLPPFKAIRSVALERLSLSDERYGWTVQFVARALLDRSIRVREVPVAFRRRRGGVSKVSGSWRASVAAGRSMIATAINETTPGSLLILVAKAPRPGHAKTRLAAELGADLTADLWAACLRDAGTNVAAAAVRTGRQPIVMVTDAADVPPLGESLGPGWVPLIQRRPGLGAALSEAFLAAVDRGVGTALVIAADSPTLAPDRIWAAHDALANGRVSAVLGPTEDGGYHLLGLRWRALRRWWPAWFRRRSRRRLEHRLRAVFGAVPMGGASALEGTRSALVAHGWRVATTERCPDLDTLADLRVLARYLAADSREAPVIADWIRRHPEVIDGEIAAV